MSLPSHSLLFDFLVPGTEKKTDVTFLVFFFFNNESISGWFWI